MGYSDVSDVVGSYAPHTIILRERSISVYQCEGIIYSRTIFILMIDAFLTECSAPPGTRVQP